jgi:hypothetical protein
MSTTSGKVVFVVTIIQRNAVYDAGDAELLEEGGMNGHDVYRDEEDGGIWYDGYYCADASDYEEAEMEYWNTH